MGQAKWDEEADASRLAADLQRKAERLSWPGARTLIVLLEVYAQDASRSRCCKRQHPESVDEPDRRPLGMAILVVAQAPLDAHVAVAGRGAFTSVFVTVTSATTAFRSSSCSMGSSGCMSLLARRHLPWTCVRPPLNGDSSRRGRQAGCGRHHQSASIRKLASTIGLPRPGCTKTNRY